MDTIQSLVAAAVAAELQPQLYRLRAELAELLRGTLPEPPPLLTRTRCARMLGVSLRTLDSLRAQGLSELRVGDAPRFEAAAVLAWLRARGQR